MAQHGESCSTILKSETAIGSKVPTQPFYDLERLRFESDLFGRKTDLLYFCPGGCAFTVNYMFQPESDEKAEDTLYTAYITLAALYGEPVLDNTPWGPHADPRYIPPSSTQYYLVWKNGYHSISASIRPTYNGSKYKRRVVIVEGKTKNPKLPSA